MIYNVSPKFTLQSNPIRSCLLIMFLIFYKECCNAIAVLCVIYKSDVTAEINVMGERGFVRHDCYIFLGYGTYNLRIDGYHSQLK